MWVDPKGFADGADVGCKRRRSEDDSWVVGRGEVVDRAERARVFLADLMEASDALPCGPLLPLRGDGNPCLAELLDGSLALL